MTSRREYLGSSRFGNVTASGMNARTMSHSASVRSVGYGVRIHPSAAVPRATQISCGIFCRTPSQSGFVHADETRLNIRGRDQYVWVFTDGERVAFRLTETRESSV